MFSVLDVIPNLTAGVVNAGSMMSSLKSTAGTGNWGCTIQLEAQMMTEEVMPQMTLKGKGQEGCHHEEGPGREILDFEKRA